MAGPFRHIEDRDRKREGGEHNGPLGRVFNGSDKHTRWTCCGLKWTRTPAGDPPDCPDCKAKVGSVPAEWLSVAVDEIDESSVNSTKPPR